MKVLIVWAAQLLNFTRRASSRVQMYFYRTLFAKCGSCVVFDPSSSFFSYSNIYLGDKVYIGGQAWFSCAYGVISIGSYVMFGPGVKILGGNHNFSNVGLPMYEDDDKSFGDDPGVSIGSDVWVGANAIILPGVRVGDGSIIAAGAVVNRDVPAFSIVAGIPAKVVKMRLSAEEIKAHIDLLKENYGVVILNMRRADE